MSPTALHNAGRAAYHAGKPLDPQAHPDWQRGWSAACQEQTSESADLAYAARLAAGAAPEPWDKPTH